MNETINEVVVGIDGSDCAAAALKWAEAYALLSGASLRLVIAWQWPTSFGTPIAYDGFDPEGDAKTIVERAAVSVSLPGDRVRTDVVQGAAGDVMVRAAKKARLLVVGTRGHGSIAGAVLGSTSTYCAHHASGPVTIVR